MNHFFLVRFSHGSVRIPGPIHWRGRNPTLPFQRTATPEARHPIGFLHAKPVPGEGADSRKNARPVFRVTATGNLMDAGGTVQKKSHARSGRGLDIQRLINRFHSDK